jgi:hypothetical protein
MCVSNHLQVQQAARQTQAAASSTSNASNGSLGAASGGTATPQPPAHPYIRLVGPHDTLLADVSCEATPKSEEPPK